MNITIIKLGALGDMVQAYHFFCALRAKHKKSHITLLTTPPFQTWTQSFGIFDDVWAIDRPAWNRPMSWFRINKKLRSYDLVIDLQNVDRTQIYRIGSQWITLSNDHNQHPRIRFQELANRLDLGELNDANLPHKNTTIFIPEKPFVLLVPGASNLNKCWPQENFERIAEGLIQIDIQPIVIGRDQYNPFLESLKIQTSFDDIVALGSQALISIGNDTGPQLLAHAGGAPTITFYGPKNPPTRGGPWGGTALDIKTSAEDVLEQAQKTIS